MSRGGRLFVHLVPVFLAIALLWALDLLFIVSLHSPAVFYGLAGILGLATAVFAGSTRWRALRLLLVLLAAFLISALDWTTDKRFVRALSLLKPGMSEAAVRESMAGFVEGTGWPGNPLAPTTVGLDPQAEIQIEGALVFRPSAAPGDSNWGIIRFGQDHRVVSVDFSAD